MSRFMKVALFAAALAVVVVLFRAFTVGLTPAPPAERITLTIDEASAVGRFQEALRFRTISTQDGSVDTSAFLGLHEFLRAAFPLVHQHQTDPERARRLMLDIRALAISDVKLITPRRFADTRGHFVETWNRRVWAVAGVDAAFVQDSQSLSTQVGTVRGLHFQRPPHAQAKLVSVLKGKILDVVVDLRKASSTFGRHVAVELDRRHRRAALGPPRLCPWLLHAGARNARRVQSRRALRARVGCGHLLGRRKAWHRLARRSGPCASLTERRGPPAPEGRIALNKLGMTTIYLKDGSIYINCTIRAINPLHVEYIKNKTLHDFHIERFKCIVPINEEFVIWFNEEKKPVVSKECGVNN